MGQFFLPDKLNAVRYTDFLETDFFDYLEDYLDILQQRIEMWFQWVFNGYPAHYGRMLLELG